MDFIDPIDKIPDFLKCPICMEIPKCRVFQCKDGHTLCEECYTKITNCPQCRVPFGSEPIRTLVIEQMLDGLKLECPYKKHGCTYKAIRKSFQQHLETCTFNVAKFGPLIYVCKRIGYENCNYRMNRGTTDRAIQHLRDRHGAEVRNCDGLKIKILGFLHVAKPNQRIWTPIILNKKEEGHAYLILVIVNDKNSIAWAPLHMPYPSASGKGESSPYQVECSVKGEHTLSWTIAPINLLDVGDSPLGFNMSLTQVSDKPSEDIDGIFKLCKSTNDSLDTETQLGIDETIFVPDNFEMSAPPPPNKSSNVMKSGRGQSHGSSMQHPATNLAKKVPGKKSWKSSYDLNC